MEAARRAGVTIAVGYDSGPPGTSAQEILRLGEAGLSSLEAIAAATAGGAAALGRTDLGSLDPGPCADLIVMNGRPDEDLTTPGQPGQFRVRDEGRRDHQVKGHPSEGRVVIVGAGIVGSATAYHLARLGWTDIVLIDQGDTIENPGSTSHAPGGVVALSHNKLLTQLAVYSSRLYAALEPFSQDRKMVNRFGTLEVAISTIGWPTWSGSTASRSASARRPTF